MPGALTRWEPFADLGELRTQFDRVKKMALPAGVDAEKIAAKTHDGVVEVTVPLPRETEKKKVQITPTAA